MSEATSIDSIGSITSLFDRLRRFTPCGCGLACLWFRFERNAQTESAKSDNLYLYVDLPRFDFPIVFSELVR